MNDQIYRLFTEHYYIPIYLLTWLVSVFTYKRYFDTALKYFPVFIAYTFFTELLGYFIKFFEDFQFFSDERYSWRNIVIYNVYQLVAYLFFFRVYWRVIKSKNYRNWIKYGTYISLLGYVVNIIFNNPFYEPLYYAEMLGAIILTICIVFYFIEKRKEENPYPQRNNLLFWVSIGTLIFYLISPYMWLIGYLEHTVWFAYHFRTILFCLIALMYSFFIIGFLLGKRQAFR